MPARMEDLFPIWNEQREFVNRPYDDKAQILTNYFDRNLADERFSALAPERQESIKGNFVSKFLGTPHEGLSFQAEIPSLTETPVAQEERDPFIDNVNKFCDEVQNEISGIDTEIAAPSIVGEPGQSMLESITEGLTAGWYELSALPFDITEAISAKVRPVDREPAFLERFAAETADILHKKAEEHPISAELQGKNLWDNPEIILDPRFTLYGIGNMAPSFLAAMIPGMAVLKYGRLAAATVSGISAGLMEGTHTYRETLERGEDVDEAFKNMMLMTVGSGILNSIGFGKIFQKYSGKRLIQMTATALTEAATEYAEEPLEAEILGLEGEEYTQKLKDGLAVIGPAMFMGGSGSAVVQRLQHAQDNRVKQLEQKEDKSLEEDEQLLSERKAAVAMKDLPKQPFKKPTAEELTDLERQQKELDAKLFKEVEEITEKIPEEEEKIEEITPKIEKELDEAAAALEVPKKKVEPEKVKDIAVAPEGLSVEKVATIGTYVSELGSVEAVKEVYPADTAEDRYARARAEELFGEKVAKPPVKSVEAAEREKPEKKPEIRPEVEVAEEPAPQPAKEIEKEPLPKGESYIEAKKQVDGKYKLFYRGTRNEVFPGEVFKSAAEARQYFKAQQVKEPPSEKPPAKEVKEEVVAEEEVKIEKGDWITDGLIRGRVVGEGTVGKNIPVYKIDVGKEKTDVILKDQARPMVSEKQKELAAEFEKEKAERKPISALAAEEARKAEELAEPTDVEKRFAKALEEEARLEAEAEKAEKKIEVEAKGKEKTVLVDLTKKEEAGLTLSQQKKYLVAEIDTAIKEAKYEAVSGEDYIAPEAKWAPDVYEKTGPREKQYQENKKKYGAVVIEVPDDGTFTILNTKKSLQEFKKKVKGFPASKLLPPKLGAKPVKIPAPLGKRLKGVEYYNAFRPRKQKIIEADETMNQYYANGFYTQGQYAVKVKEKPKAKLPYTPTTEEFERNLEQLLTPPKTAVPAEIVGEYAFERSDEFGRNFGAYAHAVSEKGRHHIFNAQFIDIILTEHPKAKPIMADLQLFFKEGNQIVGTVMALKAVEGAEGSLESIHEVAQEGYKELQKERKAPKTTEELLPARTADTMSDAIALASPAGKMSAKAKAAAAERLRVALFGKEGLQLPAVKQPTKVESNLRRAKELRDLAARGMKPQAYIREAEKLEREAAKLIAEERPSEPRFATKPAGKGQSAAIVERQIKSFKNKFAVPIEVVQSVENLPEGLRESAIATSKKGQIVSGIYDTVFTNKIYLVADGIATRKEAVRVTLHEAGGHLGLRRLLGKDFDSFLDELAANPEYADAIKAIAASDSQKDMRTAADEWFARQAEVRPPLMRRLLYHIRRALRAMGIDIQFSKSELEDLVMRAHKAAREPVARVGAEAPLMRAEAAHQEWYSQMQNVLEQKLPGKGTAESYRQTIESWSEKGEFKAEELEWSGLLDDETSPLQKEGKINKEEVVDWLRENNARIEEVRKGEKAVLTGEVRDLAHEIMKTDPSVLFEEATEKALLQLSPTKFAANVLPGGENYREILLTLPLYKPGSDKFYNEIQEKLQDFTKYPAGSEERARLRAMQPPTQEPFTATHWEEPNVLAHLRLTDRTDAEGNRILFIEEIQSDWGLAGRQKGWRREISPEETRLVEEIMQLQSSLAMTSPGKERDAILRRLKPLEKKRIELYGIQIETGVPRAPFVEKTWPLLVMKKALRIAAEEGYDKIGWTTGEQQAERYDLSKQLESVDYQWLESGEFMISGVLASGEQHSFGTFKGSELAGVVGKDLAEKITKDAESKAGHTEEDWNEWRDQLDELQAHGTKAQILAHHKLGERMTDKDNRALGGITGSFSGVDLKVGGAWAKSLYDKMLPNIVNKYVKKWGERVGEANISALTPEDFEPQAGVPPRGFTYQNWDYRWNAELEEYQRTRGMTVETISEKEYEEANRKSIAGVTQKIVHALDISPSMRQSALMGQPLFRTKPGEPTHLEKKIASLEAGLPEKGKNRLVQHRLSTLIRNKIKAIKQGHRLGEYDKARELAETKQLILDYARKNLPKKDITRGQIKPLLTELVKTSKVEDVENSFNRIDAISRTVAEKQLTADISKLLKRYRPKKKQGRIRGTTLTADEYAKLNDINVIANMDREAALNESGEILQKADAEKRELTPFESEYFYILQTFGDLKNKSPEQLFKAKEELQALIETGRTKRQEKDEARREKYAGIREKYVDILTDKQGILTEEAEAARGGKISEGWIKRFLDANLSLEYLLDKFSRFERGARPLRGYINEHIMPMVFKSRNAEHRGVKNAFEIMQKKLAEVYGTTSKREIIRISRQNSEPVNTGIFIEQEGEQVELILSQRTAYKRWMEWQDPTLAETFAEMGYTQETMDAIEEFMTPETRKWAEWQLYEFYPQYYNPINEVFRERYDVDLPYNAFYTPLTRDVQGNVMDTQMLSGNTHYSSLLNKHLLSRVKNKEPLKLLDGDTVLLNHIIEMEHFKAWALSMREMRAILNSRQVQKAIRQYHGQNAARILNDFIDDLSRGGVDSRLLKPILDKLRSNFTTAVLGANLTLFPKQLASVFAYAAEIPMVDFMKGIADFRKAPAAKFKILMESDMMEARYRRGFDRDIKLIMKRTTEQEMAGAKNMRDIIMFSTKMGDAMAIVMGGWSVYKYYNEQALKAGKTKKQAAEIAMLEFERSTKRSQQAGELEDLPSIMRGGSWARLFTMFVTAPNSYFRMEQAALTNLWRGRGTKAENIKKFTIAHFILPLAFQFVANGFRWDDEDQLRAAILGSFNGLLILGDFLEGGLDVLIGSIKGTGTYFFGSDQNPVFQNLDDAKKVLNKVGKLIEEGDYDWEEVAKVADAIAKVGSKVVGVPYDPGKRMYLGVEEFIEEPSIRAAKRAFGYSEWALGKEEEARRGALKPFKAPRPSKEIRKTLREMSRVRP